MNPLNLFRLGRRAAAQTSMTPQTINRLVDRTFNAIGEYNEQVSGLKPTTRSIVRGLLKREAEANASAGKKPSSLQKIMRFMFGEKI